LIAYPAVVLAAWLADWEGGMLACLVALVVLPYAVLPPSQSFRIDAARDAIELGVFAVLSALLAALVTKMRRALAAADAARTARDAMVAIVGHDLRNPLQTIGLNAELLGSELDAAHPEATTHLARIRRAVERARRLVDGDLDRACGGELFPLRRAPYSLAALVEELLSAFDAAATQAGVRLDAPKPASLSGTLFCDPERILQALTNVVGNAIAYAPPGETVSIGVTRATEGVRFDVRNTGTEMTPDELEHAFERGWRGRRAGQGSGLGLWVAKTIVEAHGGTISARSAPEDGTTISIVLPAVQPAPVDVGALAGGAARARPRGAAAAQPEPRSEPVRPSR